MTREDYRQFTGLARARMAQHNKLLSLRTGLAPSEGVIVPVRLLAGEDMRRAFLNLARAHIAPSPPPLAPA